MKAVWKGTVIAQSNDTVVVEGNHYFPAQSLRQDLISPSSTQTTCGWKGLANYYAEPKEAAREIKGRVAFWKGVKVVAD
jgi:uncharacterized protein (DUF427 family)